MHLFVVIDSILSRIDGAKRMHHLSTTQHITAKQLPLLTFSCIVSIVLATGRHTNYYITVS